MAPGGTSVATTVLAKNGGFLSERDKVTKHDFHHGLHASEGETIGEPRNCSLTDGRANDTTWILIRQVFGHLKRTAIGREDVLADHDHFRILSHQC